MPMENVVSLYPAFVATASFKAASRVFTTFLNFESEAIDFGDGYCCPSNGQASSLLDLGLSALPKPDKTSKIANCRMFMMYK